jgi:hypothetical protein
MGDYYDDEGSGLELVHVSDILDYLGHFCIIGFESFVFISNMK